MELLLAAIGLAVALWMILSARKRHRDDPREHERQRD